MINQVVLMGRLVAVRKHNVQIMVEEKNIKRIIDLYMSQEMLDICDDIITTDADTIIAIKGFIESYEGQNRVIVERLSARKSGAVIGAITHE